MSEIAEFLHHGAEQISPKMLQGIHKKLPALKLEIAEIDAPEVRPSTTAQGGPAPVPEADKEEEEGLEEKASPPPQRLRQRFDAEIDFWLDILLAQFFVP